MQYANFMCQEQRYSRNKLRLEIPAPIFMVFFMVLCYFFCCCCTASRTSCANCDDTIGIFNVSVFLSNYSSEKGVTNDGDPGFNFSNARGELREQLVLQAVLDIGSIVGTDLSNVSDCYIANVYYNGYCAYHEYPTASPSAAHQIMVIFNGTNTGLSESDIFQGVYGVVWNIGDATFNVSFYLFVIESVNYLKFYQRVCIFINLSIDGPVAGGHIPAQVKGDAEVTGMLFLSLFGWYGVKISAFVCNMYLLQVEKSVISNTSHVFCVLCILVKSHCFFLCWAKF